MNKAKFSDKKIVVIGGGTGSFALLSELKHHFSDITALVNMVDDGGSTGVLRDELGVLPPGDVRQCLVALSEAPDTLRRLFNFRFAQGTFAGHSFGNLFLSAVERMTEDFNEGVTLASEVLQLSGKVVPMTLDDCSLHMKVGESRVHGEFAVSKAHIPKGARPQLWLKPPAKINPHAIEALSQADMIVIAPGDLYGSLIPSLLVGGVTESLKSSKAKLVYVSNLVNKPNQTKDFSVIDYTNELERFMGGGKITTVLYNVDTPSDRLMKRYALEGEFPLLVDKAKLAKMHYRAIPGKFLKKSAIERDKSETKLSRSYIRHDGQAIAKALKKLAG